MAYIDNNFAQDLTLAQMAGHFSYSKDTINRVVKAHLGISPYQYIQHLRIKRAINLLVNTNAMIGEIAASVGYHDFSVFYKAFKKITGQSPNRFRTMGADPRTLPDAFPSDAQSTQRPQQP